MLISNRSPALNLETDMNEQDLRANAALQELQHCNTMLTQRLVSLAGENAVLNKRFEELAVQLKELNNKEKEP